MNSLIKKTRPDVTTYMGAPGPRSSRFIGPTIPKTEQAFYKRVWRAKGGDALKRKLAEYFRGWRLRRKEAA